MLEKNENIGNASIRAKIIRIILIIAGISFIALALISLLNTVLGFRVTGEIIWLNLFYVALNVFAAWGLFTEGKWIVPAFGINWLSTLVFFVQSRLAVSSLPFDITSRENLMIISSTTLFLFVFASRKNLSGKYFNMPFAIFIALWAISLVSSL